MIKSFEKQKNWQNPYCSFFQSIVESFGMHYLVFVCMFMVRHSVSEQNIDLQRHERYAEYGYYFGCYEQECLKSHYDISEVIISHARHYNTTTPTACTSLCQDLGYPLAAVYNETRCSCSCQSGCPAEQLDDDECGLPCPEDTRMFCGGVNKLALYFVRSPNSTTNNCRIGEQNLCPCAFGLVRGAILVSASMTFSLLLCIGSCTMVQRRLKKMQSELILLGFLARRGSNIVDEREIGSQNDPVETCFDQQEREDILIETAPSMDELRDLLARRVRRTPDGASRTTPRNTAATEEARPEIQYAVPAATLASAGGQISAYQSPQPHRQASLEPKVRSFEPTTTPKMPVPADTDGYIEMKSNHLHEQPTLMGETSMYSEIHEIPKFAFELN